jgi:hypothetical protein
MCTCFVNAASVNAIAVYSEAGGVLRGENPWHECRRAILLMREVDGPFYSEAEGF